MGSKWENRSISEVCSLIVDCVNKTAPKVEYETPFKMLRTTNVRNGRINLDNCKYVDEQTYQKWTRRALVKKGDVLLTREAPIGEVGQVTTDDSVFLGQRLMQYRANNKILDSRYLLYSFLSPEMQNQFRIHEGSGSVVSHIRVPDCSKFEIPVPPLPTQQAIVNVLGTLDDKIHLNNQINQTLESIAQTIFKSWFVDFDPVKAKMEGHKPEGMDTETASLFPDKLVESVLGMIPEGWEVAPVSEVSRVAIGKTPPRKESEWFSTRTSDVTWVSIKDLGSSGTYVLESKEQITSEAQMKFNVRLVPANSVLLSFKLTIGRVAITSHELTTNEAIAHFILPENASMSTEYLYQYLKQFDYSALGSTSSIAYAVNSKIVKTIPVLFPDSEILSRYHQTIEPIFKMIYNNQLESKTLINIRDTLLPKLISGEIQIPDAFDGETI
jgi:type I restriction enzyme, S subunit